MLAQGEVTSISHQEFGLICKICGSKNTYGSIGFYFFGGKSFLGNKGLGLPTT